MNNVKNGVIAFFVTYILNQMVSKNESDLTSQFDKYVTKVIDFEGRKCETDADDPGGTTKFGIAQAFYPDIAICELHETEAKRIFYDDYWSRFKCAQVSLHIRFLFFDACVLHGGGFAVRCLQSLTGAKVDGIIGPETISKSHLANIRNFSLSRKTYLAARIKDKPTLEKFRKGWFARIDAAEAFQLEKA
jgi:lysozyme family protein